MLAERQFCRNSNKAGKPELIPKEGRTKPKEVSHLSDEVSPFSLYRHMQTQQYNEVDRLTIVRSVDDRGQTQIEILPKEKEFQFDKSEIERLSIEALGILAFLASHGDGAIVPLESLVRTMAIGHKDAEVLVGELVARGLICSL